MTVQATDERQEAVTNPLIYLLQNLGTSPTFPMVLGALQAKGLLRFDDPYDDGLLLLSHLLDEAELDELGQSVTLEMCGGLGVPVLHLRARAYALTFRSVFPAVDGPSRGRLCVLANVEPKRYTDLLAYYARFYDHPDFEHAFALEERRLSRDRESNEWVKHEDTEDFAEAVEVFEDCPDQLDHISD
jgi:hypothetical protein